MNNSFMSDKIMPLSEAVEGYDLFDNMKVQKGIRKPTPDESKFGNANLHQWYSKHRSSEP